ncbi:F0F1 ATP synthase subunit delta [Patescibacteria group bacterium]|nr:F0F1 ATP synthase subunit delta [Patescibacteria group bacterium]MBU1612951.1 F0F1 ATP synthase subunit delta [Patescibacteria group bacterium]
MRKKISNKQLAIALYEATMGEKSSDLEIILNEFVLLLYRERKLKKFEYILKEFVKYAKKQDGIKEIDVTTAHKIDEKTVNLIKKSFGTKVEATMNLNKELLGGIMIKSDDIILDASLKAQLMSMKNALV